MPGGQSLRAFWNSTHYSVLEGARVVRREIEQERGTQSDGGVIFSKW